MSEETSGSGTDAAANPDNERVVGMAQEGSLLHRTHYCGDLRAEHEGDDVRLAGWVFNRRDHGGVIFLDLRDRHGRVQVVFRPEAEQSLARQARDLHAEDVVAVSGTVHARPPSMRNPELPTGAVEVIPRELHVLNKARTPPFEVIDQVEATEELRMRYRYLDLRRPVMQARMILRHRVAQAIRGHLNANGFIEVETPLLTRSMPEGARDYLVPSRVYPGRFYALAQSPQLYKQMLMVAGIDRYYQMARCMRDEDQRGDRQPEHTQIDVEMSFAEEDDVMAITEGFMEAAVGAAGRESVTIPFPRLTYREAVERFGTDKPDMRYTLEFVDVTAFAQSAGLSFLVRGEDARARAMCCPGVERFSRRNLDDASARAKERGITLSWAKWSGEQPTGPMAKAVEESRRPELAKITGWEKGNLLLVLGGDGNALRDAMCELRQWVVENAAMAPARDLSFLWVTDFPLFEVSDPSGTLAPAHHMFTMPREEDVPLLDTDPRRVLARHYDLVCNGVELASGSVRIHVRELQEKIMKILGLSTTQVEERFGFLLKALEYGAPPHAGIAPGLDRIVMILAGTSSIREIMAFPKTLKAASLLTDCPAPVDSAQLRELHLKLDL
jgi:aspartyl-tRNA synthetase